MVGGLLLAVWLIAMVWPLSVEGSNSPAGPADRVACGDGFAGVNNSARLRDAGVVISEPPNPLRPWSSYEEQCSEVVATQRAWSWPVGAVGAVLTLGAGLVRVRTPEGLDRQRSEGVGDRAG
jgi:hypothetical protein